MVRGGCCVGRACRIAWHVAAYVVGREELACHIIFFNLSQTVQENVKCKDLYLHLCCDRVKGEMKK